MSVNYTVDLHTPEMIDVCMRCQEEDCPGICDIYRNAFRVAHGLPTIKESMHKRAPKQGPPKPQRTKGGGLGRYNKPVEAFGERHTISEWAQIVGVSYNTLYMRLHRGETVEQAVARMKKMICVPTEIKSDGESLTVREWAKRLNVTPNCIYARIERGYTPEEAVTTERMC